MAFDQFIDNLNDADVADAPNCLLFEFRVNRTTLQHNHRKFLDHQLRDRLRKIPPTDTAFVDITGTCSYTGSKLHNLALGLSRATAVFNHAKAIGLMELPNVHWSAPQTHVFEQAQTMEPHPPRQPAIREQQGDIFRAVDINIIITHGKVPPPPRPPKLHFFQMRAIYALSLSPPIPHPWSKYRAEPTVTPASKGSIRAL